MTLKQQKQAALDKEWNRLKRYIKRFEKVVNFDSTKPDKIIKKTRLMLMLIALIGATKAEYDIILSQPTP